MAAATPYTDGDAPSLFQDRIPQGYGQEDRMAVRRRMERTLPDPRPRDPRLAHYAGDGFDFRRPVMSARGGYVRQDRDADINSNVRAPFIDLTDDDDMQDSPAGQLETPLSPTGAVSGSRPQRLPRFGRNVLDSDNEEAEEYHPTSHLPGANYLALPQSRDPRRPMYSGLRRPARPPSPPADMDDVEFVEERAIPQPRRRRSVADRQPTPGPNAGHLNGPRSITPYPTGMSNEPIDLTADNDDDVVLLNARQRDGVGANNAHPVAPGRDYGHLGHIANILREGGANVANVQSRLMQRLGFYGMEGDQMAAAQAQAQFEHNHANRAVQLADRARQLGNAVRRRGVYPAATNAAPRLGNAAAIGPGAIMMDFAATGFDMGLAGGSRPPTPRYSPPPEPNSGFTRSPAEDDVVVCPNCGDELAVASTDRSTEEREVKQEIWVIKGCGHVRTPVPNTAATC